MHVRPSHKPPRKPAPDEVTIGFGSPQAVNKSAAKQMSVSFFMGANPR